MSFLTDFTGKSDLKLNPCNQALTFSLVLCILQDIETNRVSQKVIR
jgi:hypothetical protein